MLLGQEEGAADFLVQTLAPSHFPFSVSSFRPGNLGLFGALLQPHAPEKKIADWAQNRKGILKGFTNVSRNRKKRAARGDGRVRAENQGNN